MTQNKEVLLNTLSNKFNIVGIVDLLYCESNNCLYTEIKKYDNYVFQKDERLIVIADNRLKKTFDDLPADIISVFQQYIRDCNVPHFFIIMLTNISSLKEDLEYTHNKFYYQETESISNIFEYV